MKKLLFCLLISQMGYGQGAMMTNCFGVDTIHQLGPGILKTGILIDQKDSKAYTKIVTDYFGILTDVTALFEDSIKSIYISYKEDKGGKFRRYTISLPIGMHDEVAAFVLHIRQREHP